MIRAARILAFLSVTLISCQGGIVKETGPMRRTFQSIPKDKLERLLSARIYFGHQSVGQNIIQGLQELLPSKGLKGFTFVESAAPDTTREPRFFHSGIGANGDPIGKIKAFESIMTAGMGNGVDIALMKLCYADIGPETDVSAVFTEYTQSIARLQTRFPKVVFIHLTDPLTTRESGLKTDMKRLLGRQLKGYGDNVAREKLNALLRAEYGKKSLFDIAMYESTGPDGVRPGYLEKGEPYFILQELYTDDGGHLNAAGKEYVATELLAFLAEAAVR